MEKLIERDDIDLVLINTPWELHTSMSVYAYGKWKTCCAEVPVYTLEDCWKLIEVSERTKKHFMMMENCNYNEEELWVLNMIQEGVFGDITHGRRLIYMI